MSEHNNHHENQNAPADTRQGINKVLTMLLNVSEDEIKDDSDIPNDLGADSLDFVEIGMELEKEFNISIPDSVMENVRTVEQLQAAIDVIRTESN